MEKNTYVTQPSMPPLDEFLPYLEKIWDSKRLTNCGPFHQELEEEVGDYLGVENVSLFANGTIALIVALQSLRITSEVITTPYSFVATSHALFWNNIKPVYVDIDPKTLNLDPERVESAITPKTTAIMPVHCYGNPCDVGAIEAIASKYNLHVIYDAAHAFGVQDAGGSVLRHGDLSILSFHATKVFNTFEGGAIISPDNEIKRHIDLLKNFGFTGETDVILPGINGKMSELHAAFGLLQLQYVDECIDRRRRLDEVYRDKLNKISGIHCLDISDIRKANYAYFPVLVNDDYPLSRDELMMRLNEDGIFPRRYFYPLISDFPMYSGLPTSSRENLPNAASIAERILCLPMFPELEMSVVNRIVRIMTV